MIAHFTTQLGGGANIAGRRLHEALRRGGVDSKFYYGAGESNDPSVLPIFQKRTFFWRNMAALATSWRSRRDVPGGFVTSPRWVRKTPIQAIGQLPSVVQLHWVTRWLDLPSFFGSLPPQMPVVWTLHDLIPITGGCHYPGECDGFTKQCGNCPQQTNPRPNDATRKFFHIKAHWYKQLNLHIVGNSEWTTAQARRSALVSLARSVRTIHYGLDASQYQPVDKATARKSLRIPEGKFVVGFACSDFHEKRKGAELLLKALSALPAGEVVLVVLGGGLWPRNATTIETVQLGNIGSPRLQSVYYSALDVFAMPSHVETFGNVAMEAMACETPVVAYPAGGLADVVADGKTGLIEKETGSVEGLARMLQWMLSHPKERVEMGIAGRRRVLAHFTDTLMAQRYSAMYHELAPGDKDFLPGPSAAGK
ncbi:MAG TPA: glycosyltransferase [Verrucomicrobiae bacterium]|jgi:glycosyltransferase involved in cell wall biosynthesis